MGTDDNNLLQLIRKEIKNGIESFRQEVKQGFAETSARIEVTNERLSETNLRLDAVINMTRDFRTDVSEKLGQISRYVVAVEKQQEERISALEARVDRLEDAS